MNNCVVNSVKMLKIDQSLEVPIFLECPHQLFVKVNWSEMLTNCDVKSSKMLTNLQSQSFQVCMIMMEKITICSYVNGVYTLSKTDSWGQEELLYFSHIVPKHGIYYSYKQN